MGYYLYDRSIVDNEVHLKYRHDICLAGCNNGIVPLRLAESLPPGLEPTFAWTWPVAKEYHSRNQSVLIDIKPKQPELFYCELDTVFGICYDEWTPVMYRLRRLFDYRLRKEHDENHFIFDGEGKDIIYTTGYMMGTVREGHLVGKWTAPARSSTNGVLLWPDALTFFYKKIREHDEQSLNEATPEFQIG